MLTLPGLIDIHVHLRTPGQEQKEDFFTGTSSALAGGFTTVLDMPNNKTPITTQALLQQKIDLAKQNIVCDTGFYFGSLGDNLEEFKKVKDLVFGLKLYLNITTGGFIIDEEKLNLIYKTWNKVTEGTRPILLHAEADVMDMVASVVKKTKHPTHICHVSSKKELLKIIELKEKGLPITCGVTPHHLFLTEEDAKRLGPYGRMKPFLKSKADQEYLWQNLDQVDVIESDHAPHTKEEKEGENPPFGVPGLETTLPLLLTAVHEGRLAIDDVKRLLHTNPKRIFNIPNQENTYVEVDENEDYKIRNENLKTKCKWSPFNGWPVKGKVKKVVLRGHPVYDNEKVLTEAGSGKIIYPEP